MINDMDTRLGPNVVTYSVAIKGPAVLCSAVVALKKKCGVYRRLELCVQEP